MSGYPPSQSPFVTIIMFTVVMFVVGYVYFLWVRSKYTPAVEVSRCYAAANGVGIPAGSSALTILEAYLTDHSYKKSTTGDKWSKDGKIIYQNTGAGIYYDTKGGIVHIIEIKPKMIYEVFNSTYIRVAVINCAEDVGLYYDSKSKLSTLPPFYWSLSNIMSF